MRGTRSTVVQYDFTDLQERRRAVVLPSQTGTGGHVSSVPYLVPLCTLILLLLVPGNCKEGGGFDCKAPGADSHIESHYQGVGV